MCVLLQWLIINDAEATRVKFRTEDLLAWFTDWLTRVLDGPEDSIERPPPPPYYVLREGIRTQQGIRICHMHVRVIA